ncbi:MAG TPA: ferrous iron transport protein B [Candidatus Competibacteraceae bacterium]|nr:MAG: ferrous iron transport protein B [Candidatus Competibacteraceae bacterium]HOB61547.1 ferrous iron transport protein B [Candidatus Competibacteraceae bacterium]HQA24992.1 ferrous iron transport protein B [Candidatus Competibacteraceae bacterium]HQD55990.1 ferrous iron transport protein B [Candidatus Competibacteraceae bacterium]
MTAGTLAAEGFRPARIALVGPPNSGKTTLFNTLTGGRQKTANYPGVTVERKSGLLKTPIGHTVEVLDLPGSYSLRARSPDEAITRDVVLGRQTQETLPDAVVCVTDATNLGQHLRLLLELQQLGRPLILVLNMMDIAQKRGCQISVDALSQQLGIPVVTTVAMRKSGVRDLLNQIDSLLNRTSTQSEATAIDWVEPSPEAIRAYHREVERLLQSAVVSEGTPERLTRQLDRVLLHPVAGPLILLALLFLMFQAVFSWAAAPMDWIDASVVGLQQWLSTHLQESLLKSLLIDGIIAGVGGVVIFLPQILILFLFILLLEDSGYMTRAAFLMDRLMSAVGLNGRAFIPLLSSFACAIPGIMATRTIAHPLDRLVTILIAPLMTCSARLPVYVLLIAAFVPATTVWGGIGLQGLVMFGLYATGIVGALVVAGVLRLTLLRGGRQPLLMELPSYKWPNATNVLLGLWDRARIFMRRIGTIILSLMVVLWFLSTFPAPPAGATEPAIYYSFAGMIGRTLEPLLEPIGFNWQIAIALVPGLAAREVAVAALGTVYALSGDEGAVSDALTTTLAHSWTLATALSLLAWYVFAPQCLATLAAVRRETNSWRWAAFMFTYLMILAYVAAFITYRVALALGGG